MAPEHPGLTRFRSAHAERGGTGEIVILPDAVHTAALAAAALGCEVGAIANSSVFEADDRVFLGLTSGAHRVDTGALAPRIGATRLTRASAGLVRAATGQVIGGVSPLGHPALVPTYLEPVAAPPPAGGGGRPGTPPRSTPPMSTSCSG